MIEKILMRFQFYRKRVAVMDAYAVRLSEAVEALHIATAENKRLHEELRTCWTRPALESKE